MNIQKTVFKVNDFLSWNRSGSLILSPAFQRRPVWPPGAKSLLIDTIVRGIPMPIIFLREKRDAKTLEPKREVVDGQQRLRTVISFVEPHTLKDFDDKKEDFTVNPIHNSHIAGKRFNQLPIGDRQKILDYEFSVQVLPIGTEDREVHQIFGRMNSTGYKLNHQELRNAEYYGAFKALMYRLALEQLNRWKTWAVFSDTDIARMLEVEETSDIVITMIAGVHGKTQKQLNDYYKRHDSSFNEAKEVERRFQNVMDAIDDRLGDELAELVFRRKTLFHSLFTFFYDLMFGLKSPLRRAAQKHIPAQSANAVRTASKAISSGSMPEDLAKVLRGATSHAQSRDRRLKFLHSKLKLK